VVTRQTRTLNVATRPSPRGPAGQVDPEGPAAEGNRELIAQVLEEDLGRVGMGA
jgi:hypothetical protein